MAIKWERERSWITGNTVVGEFVIENCPWMGAPGKPYTVSWWPADCRCSDPVPVGKAATETGGKRMVTRFLKHMSAKFAGVAK